MKPSSVITAIAASLAMSASINAQSLSITGVVSETKGTSASIPGGGDATNTDIFNVGTVGVFQMNNGAAYMRVQATNPTGSLTVGADSLMAARTVNSQGLTDNGTLSVYVRPSTLSGLPAATAWTLDLNFSFFSDAGLTTAMPLGLQLTSFDIDYFQRYYVKNSSFTFNTTSFATSLTAAPSVAGYTGYTAGPDSLINNPNAAVASWGYGNSFDVRIGHQTHPSPANPVVTSSAALFMFEFRQPSSVTGLAPEPSSALLALTGVTALGLLRRRQRNA